MNETWLRIKGWVGASKAFGLLIGIFALVLGVGALDNLNKALVNISGAQRVSVSQLTQNEIGPKHYVTVSGVAGYSLAYQETDNGVTVAIIYPLIDTATNKIIFVRSKQTSMSNRDDERATVTGMLENAPSDLQSAIEKDTPDINAAGYETNSKVYLLQDEKPGDPVVAGVTVGGLALLTLIGLGTLFFPSTVFYPQPPPAATSPSTGPDRIAATGTFLLLKSISPNLEFGRGARKFLNAVANILIVQEKWLAVYIRFVQRYRVYGVPVSTKTTDWAVVVKPTDVLAIEPGKLYGWRDRWAVSIRYKGASDKEQTLIVSFENAGAQVRFMNFLREKGYPTSLQYNSAGASPVWG